MKVIIKASWGQPLETMKIGKMKWCAFLLILLIGFNKTQGQNRIDGHFKLDTTIWNPMAYLADIEDFTRMNEISYESIIQQAPLDSVGNFSFNASLLDFEDHFYRIHFSKKGDSPASLHIGGLEENFLFLICNSQTNLSLRITSGEKFISVIDFSSHRPNQSLVEINRMEGLIDTLDLYGPTMNRDFLRNAVYDRLRQYADTCSIPLVSLYAIYMSRFETNYPKNRKYYQEFLTKWKGQGNNYFTVFREHLSSDNAPSILTILLVSIIIPGVLGYLWIRKRRVKKSQSLQKSLTVQERKILELLKEGKSNKDISSEFNISPNTVKTHINSIYSKLKINSRPELMDFKE